MIERHVYIRLNPEHAGDRAAIAAYTHQVLRALPGVTDVRVGTPADPHAEAAWDIGIVVVFESLDDVESYRVHPDHRALVDEYLAPRMKVIKAWNFALRQ